MNAATTPDRYVVMGNPIAHSKSPRIHQLFAQQTAQNMSYERLLVELDGFAAAVDAFQRGGGKGANVTVPFKEEAWRCVSERSVRAERAGAVNTLLFRSDGSRFGDNTDGVGLLRDLTVNNGIAIAKRRVLVVGAGGAVRGILEPLLAASPQCLVIANRTPAKAQVLVEEFVDLGAVEAHGFEALQGAQFDVVINATSASLHGEVPPLPASVFAANGCAYDLMYGPEPTVFMRWSRDRGAVRVVDGLGMLVEQAAEAFFLWRNVRPQTLPVIDQLRRELAA